MAREIFIPKLPSIWAGTVKLFACPTLMTPQASNSVVHTTELSNLAALHTQSAKFVGSDRGPKKWEQKEFSLTISLPSVAGVGGVAAGVGGVAGGDDAEVCTSNP